MKERLAAIERVIARGPYTDTWESLSAYRVPDWYMNLKFGIFIHWGVYSVPAFGNEWYSRSMYVQGSREYEHHRATYGPQDRFGYKDFIPLFKAERFDPLAWADLFARAGARYVVPVAEHHDGFQMYRSEISHWNAYEMGPHRDVLGELTQACNARGIVNGASSHRFEHWWFMGKGREFPSDIRGEIPRGDLYWPSVLEKPGFNHFDLNADPRPTEEYCQDWLIRTCEIIDRYHPKMLYFDWWIQEEVLKPYLRKLAAYYYNQAAARGETVVINYKHDAFPFGTAVPDMERGQFADMKPYYWQTDTAIAKNSWCYTEGNEFKAPSDIVQNLVDVVSKNGTFLLNVGPRADGTISGEDRAVLEAIGDWMRVNGEAIWGTRTWRIYGEGPTEVREGQFTDVDRKPFTAQDLRYTRKGEDLYLIAMAPSADGHYEAPALRDTGKGNGAFQGFLKEVTLLGSNNPVIWTRDVEGLHLQAEPMEGAMPVVFKLHIG